MKITKGDVVITESVKARKGDLILVERILHNSYSPDAHREAALVGQTLPATETEYQFGVVAGATREGRVKAWQELGWGDALLSEYGQPIRHHRCWVTSARRVDVTGVLTAAKAHHWPGHPGQSRPFASFEQARDVIRPFLLGQTTSQMS